MPQYTITIKNQSTEAQSYILFATAPSVDTVTTGRVFSNIYKTAPLTQFNGQTEFIINSTPYAICGTAPTPLGVGTNVSTSESLSISLGNPAVPVLGSYIPVTVTDDSPEFDIPLIQTNVTIGFTMSVGEYHLPDPNNMFLGYGGLDENGEVVPLAVFDMDPNETYNVLPVVKYYVSTGQYIPGDVIDVQEFGEYILIDFTSGSPNAVVVQANDRTYTRIS